MSDSCYNFDLEPSEKKMKLEVFGEESVLSDHLVTDDSIQFPSSSGVEKLSNEEIIKEENSDEEGGSGSDDDCSSNDGNVIIVHMDIREPLSTLRSLLHKKVNLDLTLHVFTLQGNQQLESSKTLVDQCIQGEGIVQINVKIRENTKPKAIDIVDVLKPDDDYNEDLEEDVSMAKEDTKLSTNERRLRFMKAIQQAKDGVSLPNGWIQDIDFTYKLIRYSIPINPMEWEPSHVKHWLLWAVREFNLVGINLQDWANMPGYLLCAMTQKDFSRRVQQDPGDVFWQHCQILKVYKTVAVRTKDRMRNLKDLDETIDEPEGEIQKKETQDKNNDKSIELDEESNHSNSESNVSYLNMVEEDKDPKSFKTSFGSVKLQQFQHFMGRQNDLKGLGGSTSLWQFLLELLVDWRYRDCIQWTGSTGEFEMLQPDIVAKMWGIRKNKPNMNYDKLSRALRYYYDGDMIAKVCGKKYVYRFICDLKFLLGYSPKELNDRVIKAEKRFKKKDK